jgi:hypothetical protein
VRWYGARGYWQIKVYNSMNPAWVPAIVKEAHLLGMRVARHVPAFATADQMIEAGYDEMTHINQFTISWRRDAMKGWVDMSAPADEQLYRAAWDKILATTKLLKDRGVFIVFGTDLGGLFSYDRELEIYQQDECDRSRPAITGDGRRVVVGGRIERARARAPRRATLSRSGFRANETQSCTHGFPMRSNSGRLPAPVSPCRPRCRSSRRWGTPR